jgi:hypothetical protein
MVGRFFVLVAVAAALLFPRAYASTPEDDVRAVEQRWLQNENRPEIVATILADEFVHVLPVGFISKEDQLSFLRQHPNAFPGKKRFERLDVRIFGETAVATGIVSTEKGPDREPQRFAFTDVFLRRGGRWLAVNAQELPLDTHPRSAH